MRAQSADCSAHHLRELGIPPAGSAPFGAYVERPTASGASRLVQRIGTIDFTSTGYGRSMLALKLRKSGAFLRQDGCRLGWHTSASKLWRRTMISDITAKKLPLPGTFHHHQKTSCDQGVERSDAFFQARSTPLPSLGQGTKILVLAIRRRTFHCRQQWLSWSLDEYLSQG